MYNWFSPPSGHLPSSAPPKGKTHSPKNHPFRVIPLPPCNARKSTMFLGMFENGNLIKVVKNEALICRLDIPALFFLLLCWNCSVLLLIKPTYRKAMSPAHDGPVAQATRPANRYRRTGRQKCFRLRHQIANWGELRSDGTDCTLRIEGASECETGTLLPMT